MKNTTPQSADEKYIAVEDLISRLGLLEVDVLSWLDRDKPKFRKDHMGRIAIPLEFLERYSTSSEYMSAFNRAVAAEGALRESDNLQIAPRMQIERTKLLDNYDICISDLESLHRKYLNSANSAGYESSVMASYLLFSRVIATLKMACLCLRNDYWTSGSLLREIDECLNVAEYFVLTKGTPKGKKALHQWFRENRAPKHEDCRKEIAKRMASLDMEVNEEQHRDLLNELYQKKSKFTHPTHATVREVTKYDVSCDTLVSEIDYGPCCHERKLHELAHFFQSSIWSSFQTFIVCFSQELPLLEEDFEYLLEYDNKFKEWCRVPW